MFLGDGFHFDPSIRKALLAHMKGYDGQQIIAEIEAEAEIFVIVRASPRPGRTAFQWLERLAAAARALELELRGVDADETARELLADGLRRLGRDYTFPEGMRQGLVTLSEAAQVARRRPLRRGRPQERARDALVQNVAGILDKHQPTETRRKILNMIAKQGLSPPAADPEARLVQVVELVLRGVKERQPRDLRGLLRDCGVIGKK
jgi:hypothetical protein